MEYECYLHNGPFDGRSGAAAYGFTGSGYQLHIGGGSGVSAEGFGTASGGLHSRGGLEEYGRIHMPTFPEGTEDGGKGRAAKPAVHRQGGNKRTAYEVVADQVYFAGPKQAKPSADVSAAPGYDGPPAFSNAGAGDFEEITGDDELPF